MIGGGEGAFIGAVHRFAARLDDHYDFVAGALSSTPETSHKSGLALGLSADRSYGTFSEMLDAERRRTDGIDVCAIVTPNHVHAPAALACLDAGVHVICDKPLCVSLEEARALDAAVARSGRVFVITYNYSGYPLIRHAREMIAGGALGKIRVVQVEYAQEWLSSALEATGQKQAVWRTDPAQSGGGGAIGDIGTHAFHLAEFVTGLRVESLCADLSSFVGGRRVDDNAHMLLRFAGGARGMLWASQVAPGNENALRIRVFGEAGGLEWAQEHPNHLTFTPIGEPPRTLTRGSPSIAAGGQRVTRIPGGHPEGYLEAFATIYSDAAAAVRAHQAGQRSTSDTALPGIADGLRGMSFIASAIRSAGDGGAWTMV